MYIALRSFSSFNPNTALGKFGIIPMYYIGRYTKAILIQEEIFIKKLNVH